MADPGERLSRSPASRIWFVRAGTGGAAVASFLADGFVGIAWGATGSLSGITDLRAIEKLIAPVYPTPSRRTLTAWAAMLRAIATTMSRGDDVMTVDPIARRYWIGKIASDYRWEEGTQLAHRRSVRWSGSLDRAHLSESTLHGLGAINTVFRPSAAATQEVLSTFRTAGTYLESRQRG